MTDPLSGRRHTELTGVARVDGARWAGDVAEMHERRLREMSGQWPESEYFRAGLAWGLHALAAVRAAAAGETDLAALGLGSITRRRGWFPPGAEQPAEPATQTVLIAIRKDTPT